MQLRNCKYEIRRTGNMNKNLNSLMCVFCEGYIADAIDYSQTQYCVPCNEYKGVITVREFLEVYA